MKYLNCSVTNCSLHMQEFVTLISLKHKDENGFRFVGYPVFGYFKEDEDIVFHNKEVIELNKQILIKGSKIEIKDLESFYNNNPNKPIKFGDYYLFTSYFLKETFDSMVSFSQEDSQHSFEGICEDIEETITRGKDFFLTQLKLIEMLKSSGNEDSLNTIIPCPEYVDFIESDILEEAKNQDSEYKGDCLILDYARKGKNALIGNSAYFGSLNLEHLLKHLEITTEECFKLYKDTAMFYSAFYSLGYQINDKYIHTQGRTACHHLGFLEILVENLKKIEDI